MVFLKFDPKFILVFIMSLQLSKIIFLRQFKVKNNKENIEKKETQ